MGKWQVTNKGPHPNVGKAGEQRGKSSPAMYNNNGNPRETGVGGAVYGQMGKVKIVQQPATSSTGWERHTANNNNRNPTSGIHTHRNCM